MRFMYILTNANTFNTTTITTTATTNAVLVRFYKLSHLLLTAWPQGWLTKYNIKCECNVCSQSENEIEREREINTKETKSTWGPLQS